MKQMYIKLENGETWKLSCDVVALDHATCHVIDVSLEDRDRVFSVEYAVAYDDNDLLEDWFYNNMDFLAVKAKCELVSSAHLKPPEIDSIEVRNF